MMMRKAERFIGREPVPAELFSLGQRGRGYGLKLGAEAEQGLCRRQVEGIRAFEGMALAQFKSPCTYRSGEGKDEPGIPVVPHELLDLFPLGSIYALIPQHGPGGPGDFRQHKITRPNTARFAVDLKR